MISKNLGLSVATSPAVYLEMLDMQVGHVLATPCELAWAKSCWNKNSEEGVLSAWKLTKAGKSAGKHAEVQAAVLNCSGLGMKWLGYDTIKSPDNRNMDFKETCRDDVKKMLIIWSQEKVWKDWAGVSSK